MVDNVYDNRKTNFDAGSCSVNAFAVIADLPWDEAQRLLELAGRRKNKPCPIETLTSVHGYKFRNVLSHPQTLGEFIYKHPKGRFLLHKYNHYFTVIDGKSHDYYKHNDRTFITDAWTVKKV